MEGLSPKSEGSELRPEKAPSVLINVRADVENEHQGAVEVCSEFASRSTLSHCGTYQELTLLPCDM